MFCTNPYSIMFNCVLFTYLNRLFPIYLLKDVTDGRTDRRTEKHGSFYNVDKIILFSTESEHRVDSCYREFIRSKNYALNNFW